MKKIIFTICITVLSITAYAKPVSESRVPLQVRNAFYQHFPMAEHVRWEITILNDYQVNYRISRDYGTVFYNKDGAFIESDITVPWRQVPFTGRMEIYHLNYKGHIHTVLRIVNSKQKEFYLIEVKKGLTRYEILLDEDGNIVR